MVVSHSTQILMFVIGTAYLYGLKQMSILVWERTLSDHVSYRGPRSSDSRKLSPSAASSQTKSLTIDIVSSGSKLRPILQSTQLDTFARHLSVRHFFPTVEKHDFHRQCALKLKPSLVSMYKEFCFLRNIAFMPRDETSHSLKYKSIHPACLCAQRRPIAGLVRAMQHYEASSVPLPDYVALTDDDTYLNVEDVTNNLSSAYLSDQPLVISGCLMKMRKALGALTFPLGGMGTFLSRGALERLLTPIHCSSDTTSTNKFVQNVCRRLQEDNLGELASFQEGMSVLELLRAYAMEEPYERVGTWTRGYCLHSDQLLGYFTNYYYIGSHVDLDPYYATVDVERLERYQGSQMADDRIPDTGQCFNHHDNCNRTDHICHYVKKTKMKQVFGEQLRQDPGLYKDKTSVSVMH